MMHPKMSLYFYQNNSGRHCENKLPIFHDALRNKIRPHMLTCAKINMLDVCAPQSTRTTRKSSEASLSKRRIGWDVAFRTAQPQKGPSGRTLIVVGGTAVSARAFRFTKRLREKLVGNCWNTGPIIRTAVMQRAQLRRPTTDKKAHLNLVSGVIRTPQHY